MRTLLPCLTVLALHACGSAQRSEPPRAGPTPPPAPHPVDPPAGPGALGPNLWSTGEVVLCTWLEPIDPASPTGPHRLRLSRRTPGADWSAPVTIVEGTDIIASWADFPSVAWTASGRIVAHWSARPGPDSDGYDVELAESRDDGRTWRRLGRVNDDRTPTEHGFVSLVQEGDEARAYWLDGRELAGEPAGAMTLRTARIGASVADGEEVDSRVCECCGTSAASTARGPVLVYRDRSNDELRDISILRRVEGRWREPAAVHPDGWRIEGCPVNGPEVAARGHEVVVAWFTAAGGAPTVRVAFSQDDGARFGPPIEVATVGSGRAPLGRVDIVAAGDGAAFVTWLSSEAERGVVRLARVQLDGGVGEAVEIGRTTAGREAGFPRLAHLGGSLLVAWIDATARPARLRATVIPGALAGSPATSSRPARESTAPRRRTRTMRPSEGRFAVLDALTRALGALPPRSGTVPP